jgi:SAM-dependent methyltransferase
VSSDSRLTDLYARAGINDIAEFYRTRYVSSELLDSRYFHAINRFDIRWARTMWVYHNVRRGSRVLDVGCGAGVLALLKRKDLTLIGVDLSEECVSAALRNGYDAAYEAELSHLPFADCTFDYVVSLDVLGHIETERKDAFLSEVKRVLRMDGVTMHGIECLDRGKRKDYAEMSEEELRRYIGVDGHVGMEDQASIGARFRRLFPHVELHPRFAICQSQEEFLKQADDYGTSLCEPDFLDYLRGMSFEERRAFNMAMGYVFGKVSEYAISLPGSEYVFLKGASVPLGSFYNEHMDRDDLLPEDPLRTSLDAVCLDRSFAATFDSGWYEAELFPPIARWMGKQASIHFKAMPFSMIRLDLTTHMPDIEARPLGVEFFLNGEPIFDVSLREHGWRALEIDVSSKVDKLPATVPLPFNFQIRADRTWQPRPNGSVDRDDRKISIAVCNVELIR